jgi:hypothetical protein
MKTFNQFIIEASREEAQARLDALPRKEREKRHVRKVGKAGTDNWGLKLKSSHKGQISRRTGSAKQQTDPNVSSSEYKSKVSRITSQGKEAHHRVSLSRAKELFKGKSPEEQQKIRDRHAKVGVHFGNDPRNLVGLSRERHTGGGDSVHRETEKMDKSIKKAGSETEKVFGAIRKLREERRNKY